MDYIAILRMFATPLGDLIAKGIAAASSAAVGYMIAKGVPADSAAVIVGGLATAASAAVSAAASSQGIQIKRINADPSNGVKVVAASVAAPAVQAPLH